MSNLNLVPAILEIEREIEYKEKLKPYQNSLSYLKKLNTACLYCNGIGKVLRKRICAEDDRPDPNDPNDYVYCKQCKGTGLEKLEREEAK